MSELRALLEYYRDLGVKDLYAPAGSQAASVVPQTAPSPASPRVPAPVAAVAPARGEAAIAAGATQQAPAETALGLAGAGTALPVAPPVVPSASSPVAARPASILTDLILPSLVPDGDSFAKIQEDIGDCQRCRLHTGRRKIVFGSGNPEARLVFVGEGPGADEDAQGLPFVGKAGQLLTQMIENTAQKEGIPIRRPDVYICNIVKCRPPENRKPLPDEMEICGQFVFRQILAIKPKAICTLGGTAAAGLLGVKDGVMKIRGQWFKWQDIPVMVTYHPSFLLRSTTPVHRREVWEDLKKVLHFVYD